MEIKSTVEELKEELINDKSFMNEIVNYTNKELGKKLEIYSYDKKEVAKEIIKLLKNVNIRDWEKIKQIIDSRYGFIKDKSNFSVDEVTLKRIENWF